MRLISFTGGLGAQILSASAYFYLESLNLNPEEFGAYLGYFRRPLHRATAGIKGDLSHWDWQLDFYGHQIRDFREPSNYAESDIVWDGKEKGDLAVKGLLTPGISSRFPIVEDAMRIHDELFRGESFACIHVRRGDYVNVASYLLPDEAFIRIARMLSGITKNLLYVSDSPISQKMSLALQNIAVNCIVANGGNPAVVHSLMRLSTILVCSNSQFSFTAALLRPENALTIFPCRHDSDPESDANIFLSKIRDFQIFSVDNSAFP